jgi:hypothetical protein
MNGDKIYDLSEVTAGPIVIQANDKLQEHILNNVKGALAGLPDGQYRFNLTNIVVDKNGRIIYCNYKGVELVIPDPKAKAISEKVQLRIEKAVTQYLKYMPTMAPGRVGNDHVAVLLRWLSPSGPIVIKDGVVQIY